MSLPGINCGTGESRVKTLYRGGDRRRYRRATRSGMQHKKDQKNNHDNRD